jgi:tRNA-2-methylthio-N6-dimethylallyladenosine synthase
MNERDSEAIGAELQRRGHVRSASEADADVVIVNTCSVRGKAEEKALGKLGLLVAGKRDRPQRRVGAVGCMVERLGADLFGRVRGLDFAVGTHALHRLPDVLDRVADGEGPVLDVGEGDGEATWDRAGHAAGGVSSFVNILYGCDRGCAYCVVPRVRGRERSRPGPEIVEEVEGLVRHGTREIVLLGQSVMSYGRTGRVWPPDAVSPRGFTEPLPRLLEAVNGVGGVRRIRFTSGHPSGCTPELARAMAELPAVCEHLHLPLQSGSDRILAKMGRGYSVEGYRQAVAALRSAVPDLALSTDIIVGFPTETREDCDRTLAFMEEIGFDSAFIFKYSPRPDTPAAGWEDDVSEAEKIRRHRIVLGAQDARALRLRERLAGTIEEVLVEGVSTRNRFRWAGRTRHNRLAVFPPASGTRPGDLAHVRVECATAQTLTGEIVVSEEAWTRAAT